MDKTAGLQLSRGDHLPQAPSCEWTPDLKHDPVSPRMRGSLYVYGLLIVRRHLHASRVPITELKMWLKPREKDISGNDSDFSGKLENDDLLYNVKGAHWTVGLHLPYSSDKELSKVTEAHTVILLLLLLLRTSE